MNDIQEGIRAVASLMVISACTAPKGKGADSIVTAVLYRDDLFQLAEKMKEIGNRVLMPFFERDAGNIAVSDACVLIGCRGGETLGINCGGCGYSTCAQMHEQYKINDKNGLFNGPNCVIKMTDLGIAIGSAVKTAQIHNVDNRVLFTAGVAARELGLLHACTVAYGIPLSVTGKNIFFDRPIQ